MNDSTIVKRTITDDETWVYDFDMDINQRSSGLHFENAPKPKKQNATKELKTIPFSDLTEVYRQVEGKRWQTRIASDGC